MAKLTGGVDGEMAAARSDVVVGDAAVVPQSSGEHDGALLLLAVLRA